MGTGHESLRPPTPLPTEDFVGQRAGLRLARVQIRAH